MRVVVDLARCQGYAQCAFLAPDTFRMRGEEALMFHSSPDEAQRDQVLRAVAACPVQAILVDLLDAAGIPPATATGTATAATAAATATGTGTA
ncbi:MULTISPECIES: ferredoxin [unclassified Streptosporangium]|uniref:ferredoxin n=1 Tax=unclassified Streptosporangium TaxID=2632669 RepID=UPI002E2CBD28|nr:MULTISPECIES: ferredoxin [unclassified Streptosporangium]